MMIKNMDNKALYEHGIMRRPRNYQLLKMFSPMAFVGSGGRHDVDGYTQRGQLEDRQILNKFYARFPQLRLMPQVYHHTMKWGISSPYARHPAQHFIDKYKKLCKQGYNSTKAFAMVEEELNALYEGQRDDFRLLRGAALASHGDSYLDRAQRVAELESELKLHRMVRDIPKYERSQSEQRAREDESGGEIPRQSIDDLFFVQRSGSLGDTPVEPYQPVMYRVVKNKKEEK